MPRVSPVVVALWLLYVTPGICGPATATPNPAAHGNTFELSAADSLVYALVRKSGAASAIAHDHVIKVSRMTGQFRHPTHPEGCKINVQVPVIGLLPDLDEMRKAVGFPDLLSDSQRAEIRSHIRSENQLASNQHPSLSFTSTSCSETRNVLKVDGKLTIRGKSHAVSLSLTTSSQGNDLQVKGRLPIKQSWFGYEPYSALGGLLKVEDHVEIVLDLALRAAGDGASTEK